MQPNESSLQSFHSSPTNLFEPPLNAAIASVGDIHTFSSKRMGNSASFATCVGRLPSSLLLGSARLLGGVVGAVRGCGILASGVSQMLLETRTSEGRKALMHGRESAARQSAANVSVREEVGVIEPLMETSNVQAKLGSTADEPGKVRSEREISYGLQISAPKRIVVFQSCNWCTQWCQTPGLGAVLEVLQLDSSASRPTYDHICFVFAGYAELKQIHMGATWKVKHILT